MVAEPEAIVDYEAQAREFLELAHDYLARDKLHQASEKGWGAAAHMAKAVALAQGWDYNTHAEFSVVLNNAVLATGNDRLRDLRGAANELHSNYYRRKRHLNAELIGRDIENVSELLGLLTPLLNGAGSERS